MCSSFKRKKFVKMLTILKNSMEQYNTVLTGGGDIFRHLVPLGIVKGRDERKKQLI